MPELEEIRGKTQVIYCPLSNQNCKKRCIFYHTEYFSGEFKECLLKKLLVKILTDD